MQAPSEKNVIPIFSKRKRPRQALYAHPGPGVQDASSANSSGGPAPYSWHSSSSNVNKNHQGPYFSQADRTPLAPTSRPNRPHNQDYDNTSSANSSRTPGLMNVSQRQQRPNMSNQATGGWRGSSNQTSSSSSQGGLHRSDQPAEKVSRTYPPAPQTHRPPNSNYQQRGKSMQQSPNARVPAPPMASSTPGLNKQSYSQPVASPRSASVRKGPSPLSGGGGDAPSTFRMPASSPSPSTPSRPSKASSASWEMRDPHGKENKVDTSLKILTVGIEELRYWTASRDVGGPVFFELFGVLNSAVCSDESGVAKRFTVKDGNHTLQCIFYETDRGICPLTRGQCLRCMGSILPREGVFRCVSVRPVTSAEHKVMRNIIANCDRKVKVLLTATGIEP